MALDEELLSILACPDTHHAPLTYDALAQTLTCTECGRIFEVRDDIPVLLLDEARRPADDARRPADRAPTDDQPGGAPTDDHAGDAPAEHS